MFGYPDETLSLVFDILRDSPISLVRTYLTSFFSLSAGRIDHGHHDGSAIRALTDAVALNKAVAKAIDTVNKGNGSIISLF